MIDIKDSLLAIMKTNPKGLNINEIRAALGENARSLRTVQRFLNELLADKKIVKTGRGRATRYHGLGFNFPKSEIIQSEHGDQYLSFIPLSKASQRVVHYIKQPLAVRRPVSYHRDLLDEYQPNITNYLDDQTKSKLYSIGKTDDASKPAGTYGRKILDRLLIDLSWASSRLEGNTYSRLDTERLIEYSQVAEGKDLIETQMILNHKDAIKFLVDNINKLDFNRYTFLNLHGLLSEGLLPNPDDSGRLRHQIVDISGTVYKPMAIPQMIEECFDLILSKVSKINDPFEQAFFLMLHIPYLQPFIDVNKRVSRLAANISLLKQNLCPLTFIDVPDQAYIDGNLGVYEVQDDSLLKDVFIWAYERSAYNYLAVHKSLIEPDPIRLRNRVDIQKLIKEIVQACDVNYLHKVNQYADLHVVAEERERFKQTVIDDLNRLHEGVLARYQITLLELNQWQEVLKRSRSPHARS